MTGDPGPRRELGRVGTEQARVALGSGSDAERLRAAILALAGARGSGSSTCPSDAARAVADDWRPLLPLARELAIDLARTGAVRLTQRGRVLDPDAQLRGPIRIQGRR
ncbi:DUF3253 domain-containing protein [Actinokineospora globicatena]|uniref:DUF3253 domain-containing protein n=1 Tax=Actinokineospora globicatena TaxID=103729 RepID=UPI00255243A5|nr:DUF3253 domain-containing protein [Actinokineospora globicatena]